MGLWCVTRCASFRFAGRSSKTPLKALTAPWVALTQQDRGWKFNFSQTSFPFYSSTVRILLSRRNHRVLICLVFWPRWVCNVVTLSTSYQTVIVSPQPPLSKCRNYTIYYTNFATSTNVSTHLRVSEQTLVPVVSLVIIPPVLNADTITSTSTNTSSNTNTSISSSISRILSVSSVSRISSISHISSNHFPKCCH